MQMIVDMKVIGRMMLDMDADMNVILMETYILESSTKEKPRDMVFINGLMVRNMMGNGKEE